MNGLLFILPSFSPQPNSVAFCDPSFLSLFSNSNQLLFQWQSELSKSQTWLSHSPPPKSPFWSKWHVMLSPCDLIPVTSSAFSLAQLIVWFSGPSCIEHISQKPQNLPRCHFIPHHPLTYLTHYQIQWVPPLCIDLIFTTPLSANRLVWDHHISFVASPAFALIFLLIVLHGVATMHFHSSKFEHVVILGLKIFPLTSHCSSDKDQNAPLGHISPHFDCGHLHSSHNMLRLLHLTTEPFCMFSLALK